MSGSRIRGELQGHDARHKHGLPLMTRGGGGSIINIASTGAAWGQPRSSAYGTTKAAVVALTRYIAVQHLKDGIRCNAISPE